jgi:hypothetical protein
MVGNKDGHTPSPLIMFMLTVLHDARLEWQKNKAIHLKAFKTMLKADRPGRLNYFSYKNDTIQNASCRTTMGHKLLALSLSADTYTSLPDALNAKP